MSERRSPFCSTVWGLIAPRQGIAGHARARPILQLSVSGVMHGLEDDDSEFQAESGPRQEPEPLGEGP